MGVVARYRREDNIQRSKVTQTLTESQFDDPYDKPSAGGNFLGIIFSSREKQFLYSMRRRFVLRIRCTRGIFPELVCDVSRIDLFRLSFCQDELIWENKIIDIDCFFTLILPQ